MTLSGLGSLMPAELGQQWRLERFIDHLDYWIDSEHPPDDLRLTVTAWVLTRYEDPYQGVQRESGFENLWFGQIPNTRIADAAVACSYWVLAAEHTVRCNSIATLNLLY